MMRMVLDMRNWCFFVVGQQILLGGDEGWKIFNKSTNGCNSQLMREVSGVLDLF